MRRKRLQENTFANAGSSLRNGYYDGLKKALEYIAVIKDGITRLDDVVNGGSSPLFTIVGGEEDRTKYPVLADWFPDHAAYNDLEADLQTALAELEPLMEGGSRRKLLRMIREEVAKAVAGDKVDDSRDIHASKAKEGTPPGKKNTRNSKDIRGKHTPGE